MKLSIHNNKLIMDLGSLKLRTAAQRHYLKTLVETGDLNRLIEYVPSFHGQWRPSFYGPPRARFSVETGLEAKAPETVLREYQRSLSLDDLHRPSRPGKWIGVEIECLIPYRNGYFSTGRDTCETCGGSGRVDCFDEDTGDTSGSETDCVDCDGSGYYRNGSSPLAGLRDYLEQNRVKWTNVKSDGSISEQSGYFGAEITVLTRLDNPENLRLVCSLLNRIGAKVNKSCGMHVHLDARHLSAKQVRRVGRNFERSLPVLKGMVPPSRHDNRYCAMKVSNLTGDRYCAVNLTSFSKYKTVEVRLHSSTTDFQKIISWSQLIHAIMVAPSIPRTCSDINDLETFISIPSDLLEYVAQRTALFNGEPCSATAADNDTLSA